MFCSVFGTLKSLSLYRTNPSFGVCLQSQAVLEHMYSTLSKTKYFIFIMVYANKLFTAVFMMKLYLCIRNVYDAGMHRFFIFSFYLICTNKNDFIINK